MELLDGKVASKALLDQLRTQTQTWVEKGHRPPHLAAILVGEDGPSQTYVNSKVKTCKELGFGSTLRRFDADIPESQLLAEIMAINQNPEIDGLIVQLPLPAHISTENVIETIRPEKDVDGFHPKNLGRMAQNQPAFISATPFGILKLLAHYQIPTTGLHCVVLGRSPIVGQPMSILMARNTEPGNCTVTICHSRTQNLREMAAAADLLIVAMGRPKFVNADMVKEGAIVVDVGITRVPDESRKRGYRLEGDVDFEHAAPKTSFITPVPGGVGRMTIAGLMYNTYLAATGVIYPNT